MEWHLLCVVDEGTNDKPLSLIESLTSRKATEFSEISQVYFRCILERVKGWFSLAHKHDISITSENTRDISVSISRNIRRTNPLICLMLFSLAHEHKRISISISARKTNMFVFLVLMLMLMLMLMRE